MSEQVSLSSVPGMIDQPPPVSLLFAQHLAEDLSGIAEVVITYEHGGLAVGVSPDRPGARAFHWIDFGDEIIVEVGSVGGRWELAGSEEDLELLRSLVWSVIAGGVTEVFSFQRSRVTVTLPDGTRETETGYEGPGGCLPLPLWPRWSRTVKYLPYR
ncbi:hypothetical protein [Pilimelia columellifera]|uniref:hypothetical protein n=1 Tax=Pilimelia columellifera TaxID=706574 RepID=UPI0031DE9F05